MRNFIVDYSKYSFKADDDWGDYDNGKFRKPWFNNDGYSQKNYVCDDGKWHTLTEHIAKWEYFNGRIPDGYQIDHIIPIKNGGTNKLSNLRIVTRKENSNNPISRENHSKAKIKLWANEEYRTKMLEIRNTDEWKKKQSESHKGYKWSKEQHLKADIPVYKYTLNKELVEIYPSMHEAERSTGFNRERMRYHALDGKPYKGYLWSYNPIN